jgi:hypothetical protein
MTTGSPSPLSVQEREKALKNLERHLAEIRQLVDRASTLLEFQAGFLERLRALFEAPGGALWLRNAEGQLRLSYQVGLAELGLDQVEHGRASHDALLAHAAAQGQAVAIPPGGGTPANRSRCLLLLAPIRLDQQVAGLVEIWKEPRPGAAAPPAYLALLDDLAGQAATFLARHQLRHLREQQQLWARLEAFARRVHGSLDPRAVACCLANEGRQLLDVDRASVAVRRGRHTSVEAVSGVDVVEKRSRLVHTLRTLCERVLDRGETLVHAPDREEPLPPALRSALDDYLAESNSQFLIALPLRDERDQDAQPCRSVLVAERFVLNEVGGESAPRTPTGVGGTDQILERMRVVGRHAAPALYNALEHRRIPLPWLWRPLAFARDRLHGRRWAWAGLTLIALLLFVAVLAFLPYPLRLEADGRLVPEERQVVYARVAGRVLHLRTRHGERVVRGQEILVLDPEWQERLRQLAHDHDHAREQVRIIDARLQDDRLHPEERQRLVQERSQRDQALRSAETERKHMERLMGDPDSARVIAPIDGTVITFDPHEALAGRTVKPDEPLLRIARLDGAWWIELEIPEGHVGPIREALAHGREQPLAVDILVASQPRRRYQGLLHRGGLGGEARTVADAVVVPARVEVVDRALIDLLGGMPVGVEVQTRIHCGRRAIGHVWFHELWEFFYEHVVF